MHSTVFFALLELVGPRATPVGQHPVQLQWTTPADCPSEDVVHASVERLLQGSTAPPSNAVEAQAEVSRTADGWSLRLEVRQGSDRGVRRLRAATCEELAQATALIVAMAVDPEAAARNEAPSPTPLNEPPPSDANDPPSDTDEPPRDDPTIPEPEPAPAPAPEPAPNEVATRPAPVEPIPRSRRPGLAVHVDGGVAFGLLPAVGGSVGGGVGPRWRRWSLELVGDYWTPREGSADDAADVRGRFSLWSIGVRAGPVLSASVFEFPLFVGIVAGAMHGRGGGQLDPTRARAPWVGVDAGARAQWVARPWLALGLEVGGRVGLTRPVFDTEQGRVVHQAGVLGGQARLIVEFRPIPAP